MPKSNKLKDGQTTKGESWLYSETVKEHFYNPQNFITPAEKKTFKYNAYGQVGSPACGDVMAIWLVIDSKTERIKDVRWQTFGCASAIASTSMLSVMLKERGGMSITKALKITPKDILKRLGGLPKRKIHCSVLGDKALLAAINDYFRKSNQHSRVSQSKTSTIIDIKSNLSEHDISQAALAGIKTIKQLENRYNLKITDNKSINKTKELLKKYRKNFCHT